MQMKQREKIMVQRDNNRLTGMLSDYNEGLKLSIHKLLIGCFIILSVVLLNHSQAFASTYTASGKVTLDYQGPASPQVGFAMNTENYTITPITEGQTVHGKIEEDDASFSEYMGKYSTYGYQGYTIMLGERPASADISNFIKIESDAPFLLWSIHTITKTGYILNLYQYECNNGEVTIYDDSDRDLTGDTYPDLGYPTGMYYIEIGATVGYEYTFCVPKSVNETGITLTDNNSVSISAATGMDGTWSKEVSFDTDFTVTAQKEGYTIAPGSLTASSSSVNLNSLDFTAVPDSYPSITSAKADWTSLDVSEITGSSMSITIDVETTGAKDGFAVGAELLSDQLERIDHVTDGSYLNYAVGTVVKDGKAQMTLQLPINQTYAIITGDYVLMVMLEESAQAVYLPIDITTGEDVMPSIVSASVSPASQGNSHSSQATVTFTTKNIPDGSLYYVTLTDQEGNPVKPSATSERNKVTGNQGSVTIVVPDLPAEDYKLQLAINFYKNTETMIYTNTDAIDTTLITFLNYTVYDEATSHDITGFSVEGQSGDAVINNANRTVDFYMPYGSDLSVLKPMVTVNGKSAAPASGAVVNFKAAYDESSGSYPVIYTVTAQNGVREKWTVTCHTLGEALSSKAFTDFSVAGQIEGSTVIDPANRTITVTVPGEYNENLSLAGLAASYTLSDSLAKVTVGSTPQTSGTTVNNFRNPVEYTITAQDGTKAVWTVYVNCISRHYTISNASLNQSESSKVTVNAAVSSSGSDHTGEETVVFQLMKDNGPVNLMAINTDITGSKEVSAEFNETGTGYTVRIYVFDRLAWESGCAQVNLAEPVVLQ